MKGSCLSTPSHSSHHHSNHKTPPPTPPPSHENVPETAIEDNIDYAEPIIRKFDFDTHHQFPTLFADDRKYAKIFLDAVASLQRSMHYYVKLNSNSDKLIRAQKLMPVAIKRLEKEFYIILSSNPKILDSESVSSCSSKASSRSSVSNSYEDEITEEEEYECNATPSPTPTRDGGPISDSDMAMVDLKSIAGCMIASGYVNECVNIYRLIRISIIDETLYHLGVEKLSHSEMQEMEWDVLEAKIKKWIRAVKIAVKTLFHGERILCDVVFSSSEKTARFCFAEISRDAAVNLFVFADNFGKCTKTLSPDKIFRVLDTYEAISDLWPEIELLFSHESLLEVRSEAMAAMVKLGEAVRIMMSRLHVPVRSWRTYNLLKSRRRSHQRRLGVSRNAVVPF